MRFTVSALLIMALFVSAAAIAEDSPKVQVFGGYSLLHADTAGVSNASVDTLLGTSGSTANSNFSGWNAELQYNVKPWLGAVADFGGHHPGTRADFLNGVDIEIGECRSAQFRVGGVEPVHGEDRGHTALAIHRELLREVRRAVGVRHGSGGEQE